MEATWSNDVMGGGGGGFLTCPAHWITGRGGEDLRGEVLKRHDFPVVLHDGIQVQRPLLVAGPNGEGCNADWDVAELQNQAAYFRLRNSRETSRSVGQNTSHCFTASPHSFTVKVGSKSEIY